MPEGFDISDWNIGNLKCGGADEANGEVSGSAYVATFNTEDLVGISPQDSVTLTVTGTFEVDGLDRYDPVG